MSRKVFQKVELTSGNGTFSGMFNLYDLPEYGLPLTEEKIDQIIEVFRDEMVVCGEDLKREFREGKHSGVEEAELHSPVV